MISIVTLVTCIVFSLLKYSNKILSISSGEAKIVPSLVEDRTDSTDCQTLFSGLRFCTVALYSNATSRDQAPHFPLTGESRYDQASQQTVIGIKLIDHNYSRAKLLYLLRFAVEIQPTGEVSEYTATITDETLREGKKGRHKIESLKLTLKAEGT